MARPSVENKLNFMKLAVETATYSIFLWICGERQLR